MLFCQQTHKTYSYYYLVTAKPPFILTRLGRMHQTRPGREYSMCYHTFIVYQVCRDVGVVLCRASSEKSMDSIGEISYYLNKC